MGKPYSMDLRERVIRRVEAGESCRSVARVFDLGEATVIRWMRRKRETGSFAPGQMGGHRPYLISGKQEEWLRERIKASDFTLRELTIELADRDLKVDARTVWAFVHRAGLSFKKNRAGHRTETAKGGSVPGAVEAVSGWG
jgi:transposase